MDTAGSSRNSFKELTDSTENFPLDGTVDYLKSRGVTHVTIHCAFWTKEACALTLDRIERDPRFSLANVDEVAGQSGAPVPAAVRAVTVSLGPVFAPMLVEAAIPARNAVCLRPLGAQEPAGDCVPRDAGGQGPRRMMGPLVNLPPASYRLASREELRRSPACPAPIIPSSSLKLMTSSTI